MVRQVGLVSLFLNVDHEIAFLCQTTLSALVDLHPVWHVLEQKIAQFFQACPKISRSSFSFQKVIKNSPQIVTKIFGLLLQ